MTNPESVHVDEFEIHETPSHEGFVVDDDLKADWAMRKLAHIRRKQEENQTVHDREVQRVTEWLRTVNTALENDASYFEAILKPYALLQRSEGRKTVILPHGSIKTIAGRPKIEIESEAELLAWAEASYPTALRIKKDIDKKVLNELITEDNRVISTEGEIVPAVRVIPAETSVSFVIAE